MRAYYSPAIIISVLGKLPNALVIPANEENLNLYCENFMHATCMITVMFKKARLLPATWFKMCYLSCRHRRIILNIAGEYLVIY